MEAESRRGKSINRRVGKTILKTSAEAVSVVPPTNKTAGTTPDFPPLSSPHPSHTPLSTGGPLDITSLSSLSSHQTALSSGTPPLPASGDANYDWTSYPHPGIPPPPGSTMHDFLKYLFSPEPSSNTSEQIAMLPPERREARQRLQQHEYRVE
jgi:hypothetical protein